MDGGKNTVGCVIVSVGMMEEYEEEKSNSLVIKFAETNTYQNTMQLTAHNNN